jgi:hypothetical protein
MGSRANAGPAPIVNSALVEPYPRLPIGGGASPPLGTSFWSGSSGRGWRNVEAFGSTGLTVMVTGSPSIVARRTLAGSTRLPDMKSTAFVGTPASRGTGYDDSMTRSS